MYVARAGVGAHNGSVRWLFTRWVPGLALVGAMLAIGPAAGAQDKGGSHTPDCVHWSAAARYGAFGYDHVIDIHNACDKTAACHVSTNVDPQDHPITVAAGQQGEVVTRRGSPARAFTATVRCTLTD